MTELDNLKSQLEECSMREKVLISQIEDLTDFIEEASLPLHRVNGSGVIIWANKAELEFLGYETGEYIGRHISNFHADKAIAEDILDKLINKKTIKNYPARLKCKNGEIKPVLINSNVRWINDQFVHTRCFTRDISEIRQAEREKSDLINILEEKNRKLREENEELRKKLEGHIKTTV